MGKLLEEQAIIDCLTNTAKYYEREDADEWTKGIHYGLLHGLDNILDNVQPSEAIPKADIQKAFKEGLKDILENVLAAGIDEYISKADYEARLKAEIAERLEKFQKKIEKLDLTDVFPDYQRGATDTRDYISNMLQKEIDSLKGENEKA